MTGRKHNQQGATAQLKMLLAALVAVLGLQVASATAAPVPVEIAEPSAVVLEPKPLLAAADALLEVALGARGAEAEKQAPQMAAVPLPAAAWLFGSALFGFVFLSNRKRV